MSFLSLFDKKVVKPAALVCPHCEEPLGAEHDDAGCRRRMSRRYFFGALAGGVVAAAAAAKAAPIVAETIEASFCNGAWVPQAKASVKDITAMLVNLGFTTGTDEAGHSRIRYWTQFGTETSGSRIGLQSNWVTIEK